MADNEERELKKNPPLLKRPSINIEYPENLTAGRGPNDTFTLKMLFKAFVTNFEDSMKNPDVVPFLHQTLR
jgi:hypothetical protein